MQDFDRKAAELTPAMVRDAARVMSRAGAAKGARALNASRTKAERSAGARKAALARWAKWREAQRASTEAGE